ncbi:MAG TPA: L-rhamnose mutarotase [Solirubrobacteraceae bacterium]|nr:L-rhamnose mutarotase [Solirubrobacteraceae bacterium]
MQRVCFQFTLRPGTEAEYQRRHDEIWPEMVDALKRAGISNYTLFRRGLTVIAYAECEPDAETAFANIGSTDVDARWSEWFEDVIERRFDDDGKPMTAEEVWHLD